MNQSKARKSTKTTAPDAELPGIGDAMNKAPEEATPMEGSPKALGSTSTDDVVASNKKIQENILGNIEQKLNSNPSEFLATAEDATPKKVDTLPLDQVNQIISLFAEKSNSSENWAAVGIVALVQGGGTNASMPPTTKIVNGKKYSLKDLRETVAFVTSKKGTVRQLAKTIRDIIASISMRNKWLGPLATALRKEYPHINFSDEDLVFASEIHEDNMNPNIPPEVRNALVDRAKKLREAKVQAQTKPKKKGGKKKKR